ncbi:family 43 glycosylhydrolase [Neobacillus drentensis]|uniref:family 43 glycosylhydrolase n=1 Tax=Neobacillus drentensis TaxID=220684 RepID=UPI001F3DFD97|nr:family 43 glycosylhydrolase [Neobacillus drentensis]ULT57328.1 family 43 glycosylhydrolase [Neobacillus drentensis]
MKLKKTIHCALAVTLLSVPIATIPSWANTLNAETTDSVQQTTGVAAVAQEALTTWYKFDQLNGTTITDTSGHGKDATVMNGASLTTVDGRTGIDLDYTKSQYVQLPKGIMSTLDDFTISTWVYLDSKTGNWARIFDFGTGANAGKIFLTENLYLDLVGRVADATPSAPKVGEWTHIAISKTGTAYTIYVNGKVGATGTSNMKPSDFGETAYNYIGKSNWADPYLDGKVSDFRIYNRGLSAEEIQRVVSESMTDQDAVGKAVATLALGDTAKVVKDLKLPVTGDNGVSISWKSDTPSVISDSGVVTRPEKDQKDANVTLTATISRNGYSETKNFTVTVLADSIVSIEDVNLRTMVDFPPKLPEKVTVHHYDGHTEQLDVKWNPISNDDFSQAGTLEVKGSVYGTNIQPVANISVTKIAKVEDVNVNTKQGTAPQLPSTVDVHYSDGSTGTLNVDWGQVNKQDYFKTGSFTVKGEATTYSYTDPLIEKRADPQIFKHTDGYYYFTASVPEYDRIVLRRAKTIQGLATAEEKVIWTKHTSGAMGAHIWAPELHYIDGKWYIYFAAGSAENIWDIHPYVLECGDENPLTGTWTEKGMIKAPAGSKAFTNFSLDSTTFENNGKRYLAWAQKDGGNSNLYIAEMSNPWTITGNPVMISTPDYAWERQGYWVNEGPAVLKRNGKIFMTFSASATDANYCMGLLTASDTSDLLDPKSWKKSPEPVLKSDETTGLYGPGHNSFTVAEDGKTDILVYHARDYKEIQGDPLYDPNRHTRVKRITWNADGTPNFSSVKVNGAVPGPTISVNANVTVAGDFSVITDFSSKQLQPKENLSAKVEVTSHKSTAQPILVTMALYDGENKLVDTQSKSQSIAAGSKSSFSLSMKMPAKLDGYKVKVFVWEGTDIESTSLKPVSAPTILK